MAGLIPQSFIDELLNRVDIVDVVGSRVELKKAGINHKACCPFHHEKTPSFIVNPVKQFYHCFGCGANGSAISFLMEYDNMTFPESVETLAGMIGVDVPREQSNIPVQPPSPLYAVLERCAWFYQQQLKSCTPAINYLKQRGLSGTTAKQFGIGYAPDGWDTLETHLSDIEQKLLLDAGMLIENDQGRIYDRFRDRIMFPIRDHRGRTIGFGGRVMGKGEPKYLNSPETAVFHKGESLYGLFDARKSTRNLSSLLVVEGYMDVIGLAQHGVNNAVATLGTATTPEHMERLFRTVSDVVFCFDGDRAGRKAAWRALTTTLPTLKDGREARFLFLPEGEDPDSLIKTAGQEAFLALLESAQSTSQFLFKELIGDGDLQSVGDRTRLAETAKPLISQVPGQLYRTLLYQQLSDYVGATITPESAPAATPSKPDMPQPTPPVQQHRAPAYEIKIGLMRTAVRVVLQHPNVISDEDLEQYNFDEDQQGGYVLQRIIGLTLNNSSINTAAILEHFRDAREWKYLCQLAAEDIPGITEDTPIDKKRRLFLDSISQLARAHRRRADQTLRENVAGNTLDEATKAQLRANIPYSD